MYISCYRDRKISIVTSAIGIDMLSSIAIIVIPLFLLTCAVFFIFDNNRKKQLAEQKQALNARISDSKNSYKVDVETFCEEARLSKTVRDKLYTIANNYFIYQSINEDSVANFELATKKLSQSYASLLHHFNEHDDLDTVQERVELFVDNLPTQPRSFNVGFYQNSLTTLNHLLMIPEESETKHDIDVDADVTDEIEESQSEQVTCESDYDQARSA